MSPILGILVDVVPCMLLGAAARLAFKTNRGRGMLSALIAATLYFVALSFSAGIFSLTWPVMWNVMEFLEQAAPFGILFLIPTLLGFGAADRLLRKG